MSENANQRPEINIGKVEALMCVCADAAHWEVSEKVLDEIVKICRDALALESYASTLESTLATEREKAKAFEKAAHTKEEP